MLTLRCTDGRHAMIPDWVYAEFHRDGNALGERSDPLPPEMATPLAEADRVSVAIFACAETRAAIAARVAQEIGFIRDALPRAKGGVSR